MSLSHPDFLNLKRRVENLAKLMGLDAELRTAGLESVGEGLEANREILQGNAEAIENVLPHFHRDPDNEPPLLGANEVWTGEWHNLDNIPAFAWFYVTSTLPIGVVLEWSEDGETVLTASLAQPSTSSGFPTYLKVENIYFGTYVRMSVINGPVAQAFALGLFICLKGSYTGFYAPLYGAIPDTTPAMITRSLLMGEVAPGQFANLATDATGKLLTDVDVDTSTLATEASLLTLASYLDGVEALLSSVQALMTTQNGYLDEIEGLLAKINPVGTARRLNALGTTTVKSGAGVLKRVIVGGVGGTTNITLYDSLTATGTVLGTVRAIINTGGTYPFDVSFATGLTVVLAGATDVTVVYQ